MRPPGSAGPANFGGACSRATRADADIPAAGVSTDARESGACGRNVHVAASGIRRDLLTVIDFEENVTRPGIGLDPARLRLGDVDVAGTGIEVNALAGKRLQSAIS